ncbi:MAG: MBL fold metallo-hydrolase [Deltaproteobacteria bacterium]|nr:MBL fold metallo-hydrolase [Deltaproteobacteria bacterium]
MSRTQHRTISAILLASGVVILFPRSGLSFCHEVEVVQKIAATPQNAVGIEWFGHSTFQLSSSKGTRPWPSLPQHVVTTSHQHGPHSNIWMAKGNPVVLEGLTSSGDNWRPINTSVRDISVYTVPAYHDKSQGLQRGKNAIFVFRVDGLCIAHLGDLGHLLTPAQLKMMGKIDVLLVPIAGGYFTVTASEAREVTQQVKPRIAIPQHYWWDSALEEYLRAQPRVRKINGRAVSLTKAGLPEPTEIVVLSTRMQ